MPYYCLVIAYDDDFESPMPFYCLLQWLMIFSAHILFIDASCVLYFDIDIFSSQSMLRYFLTRSSCLFGLLGE